MADALHTLPATALAAAYAEGALSPVDVTEAVLAQIARQEPQLHALWQHDADGARAQAQASAARWRAGTPLSPLDGVPGTLKENIATAGCPLPGGCAGNLLPGTPDAPAPAGHAWVQPPAGGEAGWLPVAAADAPPAARWREAGLVLLGKTTMPDWGMLSSGLSSFHALARNPWDTDCTPGGSSAGAGAAAAAGYGPLHVGTDIGGSIRLPAGWCGLVGLKPSAGRIPIQPTYVGRVAGPMTRTVADCAALMAVLARPDPLQRDPSCLPPADLPWQDAMAAPAAVLATLPRGLRLGLQLDAGWGLATEPATAAAVEAAARALARALGAKLVAVPAFCNRTMADGMDSFWRMRSGLDLQRLSPERRARVLPYIRDWVAPAAGYDGARVFTAWSQIDALRDAALAAMAEVDFLLSPTSPVPAFAATSASPTDDPQRPLEHIGYTLPFNMSGQPAVSIDCGRTVSPAGRPLPIGLQIAGQRFDDVGVLRLAAAWEAVRPAAPPWPLD